MGLELSVSKWGFFSDGLSFGESLRFKSFGTLCKGLTLRVWENDYLCQKQRILFFKMDKERLGGQGSRTSALECRKGGNRLRQGLGTLGFLAKGQELVHCLAHAWCRVGHRAQCMYFSPFSLSQLCSYLALCPAPGCRGTSPVSHLWVQLSSYYQILESIPGYSAMNLTGFNSASDSSDI